MKNLILVIRNNASVHLKFILLFRIVVIVSINILELISKLKEIDSIQILYLGNYYFRKYF